MWHRSPFAVLNGHVIAVKPLGALEGLSSQALRLKIGPVPQMVKAGQPFMITMPGPIGFKIDGRFAGGFQGRATVMLERLE